MNTREDRAVPAIGVRLDDRELEGIIYSEDLHGRMWRAAPARSLSMAMGLARRDGDDAAPQRSPRDRLGRRPRSVVFLHDVVGLASLHDEELLTVFHTASGSVLLVLARDQSTASEETPRGHLPGHAAQAEFAWSSRSRRPAVTFGVIIYARPACVS